MNLLQLLASRRTEARRDAQRRRAAARRRPMLDTLEGRQVLSTVPAPFVGPLPPAQVAGASSAAAAAPTVVETGTAFGMPWVSSIDGAGHRRVVIQDVAGSARLNVYRTKTGIFFSNPDTEVTVAGPTLPKDASVDVRAFADAGDQKLTFTTGIYWTKSIQPRTSTGSVSTPTGSVGLTYSYDGISNTGVLTVKNIAGKGTISYRRAGFDLNPGDPPVDSPSADPVRSYDFQLDGSSDYNGGVDVFRAGMADAAITVKVDSQRADQYTIRDAAVRTGSTFGLAWTAAYNPKTGHVDVTITGSPRSTPVQLYRDRGGFYFRRLDRIAPPVLAISLSDGDYADVTIFTKAGDGLVVVTPGSNWTSQVKTRA